jgi:preprotein translocase subunit SecD
MKLRSAVIFASCVILVAVLAFFGATGPTIGDYHIKSFNEMINKGLDLQGGVSVVEEIQGGTPSKATIDQTIGLLTMRINPQGVTEIVVTQEGANRIRIDIPGQFDTKSVIDNIAKTGKLEFRDPDGNVILTGSDVKTASAYIGGQNNEPTIGLEFNDSGTQKFADATEKFLNKDISIYMDDTMLTKATVQVHITDGKAIITGSKTMAEATRQANIIRSGALPVTLKTASASLVGATLGKNALPDSIKAGLVAVVIIFLFMLLYYRIPGLIADIALVLYIVLVMGAFSMLHVTLTLSGIAGFLLTIGMAVDANVLIFERIKEELKFGKSPKSAIDTGFHRALTSIIDSNVSTFISGLILYMLGSGTVKGFALTLMVGVALSLFTAVTFTKFMMKNASNMGWFNNKWAIGTFGVHDIRGGQK